MRSKEKTSYTWSTNMTDRTQEYAVTAYELVVLFVGLASSASIALLAIEKFTILLVLSFAALGTAVAAIYFGYSIRKNALRTTPFMAGIVLVGLLLRLEHWPNLTGGQDQGLYVNMSSALRRTGSLEFIDKFREELSTETQAIYDQAVLLSVSVVDSVRSAITIEFYPLHPIWMAINEYVFGPYGRHLSLIGFSLLGMAGAYHLALEIDGRKSVAKLFTALIAINPALVFFAKFPVGETVAMAFALNGFVFAIRSVRSENKNQRRLAYFLTGLCFAGLSFTRLQVLVYLPFLGAVAFLSTLPIAAQQIRQRIFLISALISGIFFISFLYYREYQTGMYLPLKETIEDALPSLPALGIIAAVGLAISLAINYYLTTNHSERIDLSKLFPTVIKFGPWAVLLALALSAKTLIDLYQTGIMYPWDYPVPSGPDALIFRFHILYRLLLFVSPIGFLLLLLGPWVRKKRSLAFSFLCIFFSLLWVVTLTRPYTPYLYYYGRYLVVDILPIALFFVAVAGTDLYNSSRKWLGVTAVAAVLTWSTLFSVLQLGNTEGESNQTLEAFAEEITEEDVLIVSIVDQRFMVPMRVTFERSVFFLGDIESSPEVIDELHSIAEQRGGRLLLGVLKGLPQPELEPVSELPFDDCLMTNSDHFRGQIHMDAPALRQSLILPYTWHCHETTYTFYDLGSARS